MISAPLLRGRQVRRYLILAGALSALPGVAHAQDDIRLSADGAANIGYSNNPFSETGGNTSSGVVDVSVTPRATLITERNVFVLSGYAQYQQYFRHYDNTQNYSTSFDYRGTPSEHASTHLGLSYDSSVIGSNNGLNGAFDPTQPNLPPVVGSDLSLFGTRDRRQTLRADGDASLILSARDTLTPSAYYDRTRFSRSGLLGNYNGYGGTLAYSREISDRLQLGGQASVAKYDYQGPQGDSTIYSVRGSFSTQFGPSWKADGAIGASFVKESVGSSGTRATLSGNLNLCHVGPRANLCATASRSVVPSGISGTQTETDIGLNYSYKLSERGTIFTNAAYVRNGNNQQLVVLRGRNESVNASIGYEHQLKQRLRIITTGRYRDIYGINGGRAADYGGQIGVAIKIGDNK